MASIFNLRREAYSQEDIAREDVVKRKLSATLSLAVKTLQEEHIASDQPIPSSDTANAVCFVLDAIFIHGLKDTFMNKISNLWSLDPDKMPAPTFWQCVQHFTHKDVVAQLYRQTQISTEVGLCRAWLRIALNDGLLASYLDAMTKDIKTLRQYYTRLSYLRDREQPDILKRLLVGLCNFEFRLAYNASALNSWTAAPLQLAGIWEQAKVPAAVIAPGAVLMRNPEELEQRTKEEQPQVPFLVRDFVPSGVGLTASGVRTLRSPARSNAGSSETDDASHISCPDPPVQPFGTTPLLYEEYMRQTKQDLVTNGIGQTAAATVTGTSMAATTSSSATVTTTSPTSSTPMQPEEAAKTEKRKKKHRRRISMDFMLDAALSDNEEEDKESEDEETRKKEGAGSDESEEGAKQSPMQSNKLGLLGNMGWSSAFDSQQQQQQQCGAEDNPRTTTEQQAHKVSLEVSDPIYAAGGREDTEASESGESLQENSTDKALKDRQPSDESAGPPLSSYEVVPLSSSVTSDNAEPRVQNLMTLVCRLCQERGLDTQNYQCNGCGRPIGMIYGKARVCSYDGASYCYECHENDEHVIPARILYNWDFRKHAVARHTYLFLEQIENEPLVDIKMYNASLYGAISELNDVKILRTQLSFLKTYLFTCKQSIADELRKRIWPQEYLYENVHRYTVSDLRDVVSGVLAQHLRQVISFAIKHVFGCALCSQKGFICEVCHNPKEIFPFQLETTFRCDRCMSVFHKECLDERMPCPKCERRKLHVVEQAEQQTDDFACLPVCDE